MSGQLALSVVGAGIGSFIPGVGTAAGWAIGSAVGGLLFAPKGQDSGTPKLEDLSVESGTYGTPIPKLFGRQRLRGILVWQSERRAKKHTEEVGGKGGGGSEITSFTYSMDIDVMFCVSPVSTIRKIFMNGKLYYDKSITSDINSIVGGDEPWSALRIYRGGDDQLPEPLEESVFGVGSVPAYRGVVRLVFDNLQLADFGNNPPNITAEIVTGPVTYPGPSIVEKPAYGQNWTTSTSNGLLQFWGPEVGVSTEYIVSSQGTNALLQKYTYDGELVESVLVPYTFTGHITTDTSPDFVAGGPVVGLPHVAPGTITEFVSGDYTRYYVWFVNGAGTAVPLSTPTYGRLDETNYSGSNGGQLISQYHDGYIYSRTGTRQQVLGTNQYLFRFPAPDGIPSAAADRDYVLVGANIQGMWVDADGVWITHLPAIQLIRLTHDLVFVESWNITPGAGAITGFSYAQLVVKFPLVIFGGVTTASYQVQELGAAGASTHLASGLASGPGDAFQPAPVGDLNNPTGLLVRNQIITFGMYDSVDDTLAEVESALCIEAGLTQDDLDVVELIDEVQGFVRTGIASVGELNRVLQPAYQFDLHSSDWKLKFPKRARPSVAATIPYTDLGVIPSGQASPEPLETVRTPDRELPRRINIDYISESRDYQTSSQSASREVTAAKDEQTVSLALLLEDDHARQVGEVFLADLWASRDSYQFTLGIKYLFLDPTDVIEIQTPTASHLVRITNIDLALPSILNVRAVSVRAPALLDEDASEEGVYYYEEDFTPSQVEETYTSDAPGSSAPVAQDGVAVVGQTDLLLLDLPIQRDADNNAGLYWAARGYTPGWHGAVVFRSLDGGSYSEVDSVGTQATMGYTTTLLPSGSVTVIDQASTVNVRSSGEIISVTEAQFHNRENLAVIGAHGRWEVIAFRDADLEVDGTYTLSYMLRGLRGTDHNIGNHTATDRFVLLTAAGVDRFLTEVGDNGVSRYYRGVSIGKPLADGITQTFVTNTESLRPLSPVHVRGKRVSGGDLTISWTRRGRISQSWAVANYVPLGESSESYSVDILNGGGAVVRTLTSTTESVAYTAAQQTTDFGSAQASISVKVYQLSATVGRGTARSATI